MRTFNTSLRYTITIFVAFSLLLGCVDAYVEAEPNEMTSSNTLGPGQTAIAPLPSASNGAGGEASPDHTAAGQSSQHTHSNTTSEPHVSDTTTPESETEMTMDPAGDSSSSSPMSASELADLGNQIRRTTDEAYARLCQSCPSDLACQRVMEGASAYITIDHAECLINSLSAAQLSELIEFYRCDVDFSEEFERCTAQPMCDGSFFACFDLLFTEDYTCHVPYFLFEDGPFLSCFNSTQCVDGSGIYDDLTRCDGVNDCLDGSDELQCGDGW